MAAAALIALSRCSDGPRLASAPATLGGLALHHQVSGATALAALGRLHDGGEIAMADAWIAHYGRDTTAMLYVGMNAGPAAGRQPAGGHASPSRGIRDAVLGTPRPPPFREGKLLLSGQGQLHFLYRDGPQVVWLSADPALACAALADALVIASKGQHDCDLPSGFKPRTGSNSH